jgi:hypothetical protein
VQSEVENSMPGIKKKMGGPRKVKGHPSGNPAVAALPGYVEKW